MVPLPSDPAADAGVESIPEPDGGSGGTMLPAASTVTSRTVVAWIGTDRASVRVAVVISAVQVKPGAHARHDVVERHHHQEVGRFLLRGSGLRLDGAVPDLRDAARVRPGPEARRS